MTCSTPDSPNAFPDGSSNSNTPSVIKATMSPGSKSKRAPGLTGSGDRNPSGNVVDPRHSNSPLAAWKCSSGPCPAE